MTIASTSIASGPLAGSPSAALIPPPPPPNPGPTTTGTFNFQPVVAEAIDEAWERCGLNPENLTARHVKSAIRSMAYMLSNWPNKGVLQWTVVVYTHNFTQGEQSFQLPVGVIDILEANYQQAGSGTETVLTVWNRQQYFSVAQKETQGRPSNYFVERGIRPTCYVWPVPDNSTDSMRYYAIRQLEDVGRMTNAIDIPVRFQEPFVAGLAAQLSKKFAPDRYAALEADYQRVWAEARAEDRERGDFVIRTKQGGYRKR